MGDSVTPSLTDFPSLQTRGTKQDTQDKTSPSTPSGKPTYLEKAKIPKIKTPKITSIDKRYNLFIGWKDEKEPLTKIEQLLMERNTIKNLTRDSKYKQVILSTNKTLLRFLMT